MQETIITVVLAFHRSHPDKLFRFPIGTTFMIIEVMFVILPLYILGITQRKIG